MKERGEEEEKKHALLFQWPFPFFLSFCKGTTRRGSNRRSMALSVLCTGAGNTKRIKCGGEGGEKMSARAGDACAMAFRFNDRGRQAGNSQQPPLLSSLILSATLYPPSTAAAPLSSSPARVDPIRWAGGLNRILSNWTWEQSPTTTTTHVDSILLLLLLFCCETATE